MEAGLDKNEVRQGGQQADAAIANEMSTAHPFRHYSNIYNRAFFMELIYILKKQLAEPFLPNYRKTYQTRQIIYTNSEID